MFSSKETEVYSCIIVNLLVLKKILSLFVNWAEFSFIADYEVQFDAPSIYVAEYEAQ